MLVLSGALWDLHDNMIQGPRMHVCMLCCRRAYMCLSALSISACVHDASSCTPAPHGTLWSGCALHSGLSLQFRTMRSLFRPVSAVFYGAATLFHSYALLQVLDVRVPGSGSSHSPGVVNMPWPGCHLLAAAGYGSCVAAGGCKGVRAWDVRVSSSSNSGGHAAGSNSDTTLLLDSHMPNREPVSLLHLDRVQLVAATSASALHSPASIAVWSVPAGQRVKLLSST